MAPSPQGSGMYVPGQRGITRPLPGDEVVISGISGIFPSSDSTLEFKENLFNKVDMVTKENLNLEHPEAPQHMGKINGITKFDAQFFRVTFSQAKMLDPMGKKLMEHAYSAMYDSGTNALAYKGKKVGVFIGSSYSDAPNFSMFSPENQNKFILSGCSKTMFANRISYWIDGKGPSYALDSACCSSMVCLEIAYRSMRTGVCDSAIVGGCNICLHPHVALNLSRAGFLCLDGKTKCFDKRGDGCVRSEAISVLFLQKKKDAKRIYAEVYHARVDYSLKPDSQFLSPRSSEDVQEFLENFYSEVDVLPKDVEYVEADGAAIAETDANELKAIGNVFAQENSVKIGCVKSNMGHSEPASGLCGVTKLCLAYHEGRLPANLHLEEPFDDLPKKIEILQEHSPFDRGFAAINNFSFGGIQTHVLLKGHYIEKDHKLYKSSIPRIVLMSGRQEQAVENIFKTLGSRPIDPEVIGLLHSIYETDTPGHTTRGYAILDTNDNNETTLLATNVEHFSGAKRPLCLVFSGMGSQWGGMGAELMKIPAFSSVIARCHKVLQTKGLDLIKIISEPDDKIFDNILNCFVGIASVQIGLSSVLKELGIVPDYVIGHSAGETACAYFDDCFTVEETILSAYYRGLVSIESSFIHGSMAAVGLGYQDVLPLCPPEIDVACHNSSESATISGPADVIKEFVSDLQSRGIFARAVHSANIAFHSRYIKNAGDALLSHLKGAIKEPKRRSDKWLCTSVLQEDWNNPRAQYSSAEYHTNNLLSPVYFEESARLIPSNAVVVEVAPHGLLQAILKRSHTECTHIPLTRRKTADPVKFLLEAIGKLYQEGYNPKVNILYPKIQFPVSTKTPLISHFVEWEHSENWVYGINNYLKDTITSLGRSIIVSLHDDDYSFFKGHIRDGDNVLPEAALLYFVWETLAMYKGVSYTDMSVMFRNVQFDGEVAFKDEKPIELRLAICKGSDVFEVSCENTRLVRGYIAEIKKPVDRDLEDHEREKDEVILNSKEIYQLFNMRGYNYKDQFQSIYASNMTQSESLVKWNHNWIAFLDSLIQINALAMNYKGISTPKLIEEISIDIQKHNQEIPVHCDLETCYNAKHSDCYKVTICGGVVVKHVDFNDKSITNVVPDALQTKSFIPHFIKKEIEMETALQIILQIVADNYPHNKIAITEVTSSEDAFVTDVMKNLEQNIPTTEFSFDHIKTPELNGLLHKAVTSANLVIVYDLTGDDQKLDVIADVINENAFVLSIEEMENVPNHDDLSIISAMTVQGRHLFLLKKKILNEDDTVYIPVADDERFYWVGRVHKELERHKKIVIVSERQPQCGLIGLVKTLKLRYEGNVRLVIIDDYQASTFSLENKTYKEQLNKNLTFNILYKGQWGGYYTLPTTINTNVKNVKLMNTLSNSIDSIKWFEQPLSKPNNNLVQVSFAGPSVRDSQKAVGILKSTDNLFGMDFSGVNSKGERVMGLVATGAMGSTLEADFDLLWPVPKHWSMEDAATVPLPYAHAYYALVFKYQLLKGQSIFINGGTGALGQAVISISLAIGCTVYTTVRDLKKKQFLMKLFPQLDEKNIGYSGKDDFHMMVLINSKQKLCDFVINSTSGALRESALKCVSNCGLFLDTSEYDMNANEGMGMKFLNGDKTYKALNLSNIFRPEFAKERKILQKLIAEGILNGVVRPISRIVYQAADVSKAFRLLSLSKHRGRVLVQMKDNCIKDLDTIPRINCSSSSTYIVLNGESLLGIQLVDRLVRRGARKLLLHTQSKSITGCLHIKLMTWNKLGATVKLSSGKLQTEVDSTHLIQEATSLGPIQGIYVVQQTTISPYFFENGLTSEEFVEKFVNTVSVVSNIDLVSRNNCAELRDFVVITTQSNNPSDEYASSACERICKLRCDAGLPGLVLRVEMPDELDRENHDYTKLLPLPTPTVLNALEISLKQRLTNVITYNVKEQNNCDVLEKVVKILGVSRNDVTDENKTIDDLLTNEINVEEIKALLKEKSKIEFRIDTIKRMPISSLKSLTERQTHLNMKANSGLKAFIDFIEPDQYVASDPMVLMGSIINRIVQKEEELDPTATYLMLIPGFEGHYRIFNSFCERLKVRAVTWQLTADMTSESIQAMAASILPIIKKRFRFKNNFYLLGYSFGVNVALELAAMLEKDGLKGVLYCLDSSPEALRAQLDAYVGYMTDDELQNAILVHMYTVMGGKDKKELKQDLKIINTWSEKVEACVNKLKGVVSYSNQYKKAVLDNAYYRIALAKTYVPNVRLESEIVLLKGMAHPNLRELDNDYNLSLYTRKPVKVITISSDHATAPQDYRLPNILNRLLDPQLLEEFRTTNLCETYTTTRLFKD